MKVTEFFRIVFGCGVWAIGALVPLGAELIARRYEAQMGWKCSDEPIGLVVTAVLLTLWCLVVGATSAADLLVVKKEN